MSVTDRLTAFALDDLAPGDALAEAQAVTELSFFDWAACGIAGAAEGGFAAWCAALPGDGDFACFDGRDRSAASAGLVNGTLSHALDFDDTHFAHIGHPSVVILPVAVALATDWDQLVDAALVGAEASIRFGLWLGRDHYQMGFHQTATAGAIGATVTAGRLLGLGADQMRHALGLSGSMASGLKAQFGTMGKPLNAGLAARTGIEAALFAQAGMTGAGEGLDGPYGFGRTHGGVADDSAFDGLGQSWQMRRVSHKFHACCHGLHAMLEALREIGSHGTDGNGADGNGAVSSVSSVDVATHPGWLSVCNIPAPQTGLEAKFSYRMTAAMALGGVATGKSESFTDRMAQDAALIEIRDRVAVAGDESLSETQARVTVKDGRGATTVTYDLARPAAVEAIAARLYTKASDLIGSDRSDRIRTAIRHRDLPGVKASIFAA